MGKMTLNFEVVVTFSKENPHRYFASVEALDWAGAGSTRAEAVTSLLDNLSNRHDISLTFKDGGQIGQPNND